jgi:hypothetical protein
MEKMKWESGAKRIRFHHFDEYISTGVQLFPDAYLVDLMKSWRIIKRITKIVDTINPDKTKETKETQKTCECNI